MSAGASPTRRRFRSLLLAPDFGVLDRLEVAEVDGPDALDPCECYCLLLLLLQAAAAALPTVDPRLAHLDVTVECPAGPGSGRKRTWRLTSRTVQPSEPASRHRAPWRCRSRRSARRQGPSQLPASPRGRGSGRWHLPLAEAVAPRKADCMHVKPQRVKQPVLEPHTHHHHVLHTTRTAREGATVTEMLPPPPPDLHSPRLTLGTRCGEAGPGSRLAHHPCLRERWRRIRRRRTQLICPHRWCRP